MKYSKLCHNTCVKHIVINAADKFAKWVAPSHMETPESLKQPPGRHETSNPQSLEELEGPPKKTKTKIQKRINEVMEQMKRDRPHLSLEQEDVPEYKEMAFVPRGDQGQFLGPSYGHPDFYSKTASKLINIANKLPCTCKS